MDRGGRLAASACEAAWRELDRLVAGPTRFVAHKGPARKRKVGPNPNRGRYGSKHHVLTDANGVPLAVITTAANTADATNAFAFNCLMWARLCLVEFDSVSRLTMAASRRRPTMAK